MSTRNMLALDLGASNGRGLLGTFDGSRLTVREIARFRNDPFQDAGHLCWNLPQLFTDTKRSIGTAASGPGGIHSIGIDAWGVDFGLLDANGQLLGNPRHYRDACADGMREAAFTRMEPRSLYRETGNAFERYNTLFQILGIMHESGGTLEEARHLLMVADLFVYLLTGITGTEFTAATTTQLVRAGTRSWSATVLDAMGIPRGLFSEILLPGSIRGELTPGTSAELGIAPVAVVTVAHHDTASAVAAIPMIGKDHAFLSSGTWSLMGVETDHPILDVRAQELGYTNEGCADGGYRLLKNIMGLWMLQECKRSWDSAGTTVGFDELCELAARARPFSALIDPSDDVFFPPGAMPERIQGFCQRTGQAVPEEKGAIVRCILESLALRYRLTFETLEILGGKSLRCLCIVGGGSKNRMLNQFTANAIKHPVMAGPEEAASIGNLLIQAVALGELSSLAEGKDVVAASFSPRAFLPADTEAWDAALERFKSLFGNG